jgi:hypothetical protein
MSSQSSNIDPAVLTITTTGAGAYTTGMVAITYAGSGYAAGNSFLIKGTRLGGASPANDLVVNVATLTTASASGVGSTTGIATVTVSGTSPATTVTNYAVTLNLNFNPSFERDASDRTRMIRERLIYNEKRAGTNITAGIPGLIIGRPQKNPAGVNHLNAGNAELLWQQQGNNFRLAYLFGKLKCGDGFGGVFNLNGPNSFNLSGAQSGS